MEDYPVQFCLLLKNLEKKKKPKEWPETEEMKTVLQWTFFSNWNKYSIIQKQYLLLMMGECEPWILCHPLYKTPYQQTYMRH